MGVEIYLSFSPFQDKPLSKLVCPLNLPPANLEWSAYVFGLSFPSVYEDQFVNQEKKF